MTDRNNGPNDRDESQGPDQPDSDLEDIFPDEPESDLGDIFPEEPADAGGENYYRWGATPVDPPEVISPFGTPTPTNPWRRFRWVWVLGGVGVLGVVLGIMTVGGGRDPEPVPSTSSPTTQAAAESTTPATTTTTTTTQPVVVATTLPPLDLATVPHPNTWTYTATKTADVVLPREPLVPEPVGTFFPGMLVITTDCTTDPCGSLSTYDLERTFLDQAEFGTREPAVWERNGADWTIEMVAHTIASQTSDFICVIRQVELWEITITDAELVGGEWIASSFTGSLLKSNGLDQGLSDGDPEICMPWFGSDTWDVEGTAASAG